MKVLFHFYDLHQRAGIQRAICELSNALVADGHEVILAINTGRQDSAFALDDRVVIRETTQPEPQGSGVSVWLGKVIWAVRQVWVLRQLVRHSCPSIVVDHGTALGLLYPFRTLAGAPFVLQRHFPVKAFPRGKVLYRILSLISHAKIVVVLTEEIASEMRMYGYKKIVVIPNMIPAGAKLVPYQEATPHTGLLMGRGGNPQKGFDLFLRALAESLIEGWHFKIVGPGVNVDPLLLELISNYKLQDKVELISATADPYQLIRRSACVIMPSRYEALPMVALEALSIGRPILASDVDGLREIVKPGVNGFLFPKEDIAKLSECLRYIEQNPQQLEFLANNGPGSVIQFCSGAIVNQWCALADELTGIFQGRRFHPRCG